MLEKYFKNPKHAHFFQWQWRIGKGETTLLTLIRSDATGNKKKDEVYHCFTYLDIYYTILHLLYLVHNAP